MMIDRVEYILLTEQECTHCSFRTHLPRLEYVQPILCPRCWRPFKLEPDPVPSIAAAGVRFESIVQRPVAPKPRPVEEPPEPHLPAEVPETYPPPEPQKRHPPVKLPEPICLQTEELDEPLSYRQKFRRWCSSYGVSFCLHAALLGLAALFVFHHAQFEWHTDIDSAFSESEALISFDQMAAIESPEFAFQPELLSVAETESIVQLEVGGMSQSVAANNDAAGEGNVGFFGTRAEGKSFAFIVDISGSMSSAFYDLEPLEPGKPPAVMSRWEKAREELLRAVDSMTPAQSFAVTLYNSTTYHFRPEPGSNALYPATKANKRALQNWLANRFPDGGTEPRFAISDSLAMKPEVVFFLTDGIIPPDSRAVAQSANRSESIIHTTCIGSAENQILQLIAQDHGGTFRAVVSGNGFSNPAQASVAVPRTAAITVVCVVSDSTTDLTKFRRLQDRFQRFRQALDRGDLPVDRSRENVLVLHNAASTSSEFNREFQQLLREVNSGLKTGFQNELQSGCLGRGISLDAERPKDFQQTLVSTHERKSQIGELLETVVPRPQLMNAATSIPKVIVFGDKEARSEILNTVEVYNLYHGSKMQVLDGEELLRK